MYTFELDKNTEMRFNKLLNLHGNNYTVLINSMIDYRINELKKGIKNIELDFISFEKKYKTKTDVFYENYQKGNYGEESHSNDFMIWSSEYESFIEFSDELKQLV